MPVTVMVMPVMPVMDLHQVFRCRGRLLDRPDRRRVGGRGWREQNGRAGKQQAGDGRFDPVRVVHCILHVALEPDAENDFGQDLARSLNFRSARQKFLVRYATATVAAIPTAASADDRRAADLSSSRLRPAGAFRASAASYGPALGARGSSPGTCGSATSTLARIVHRAEESARPEKPQDLPSTASR